MLNLAGESPPPKFRGYGSQMGQQFATGIGAIRRKKPTYCRKVYWTKMDQNGPNDHFGQNDLTPNWILAFERPKWTKMVHFRQFWPDEVHFGPFRSANRTLAIPEIRRRKFTSCERFARIASNLQFAILGPATTQNLVVKFDGEICSGVYGGKCF